MFGRRKTSEPELEFEAPRFEARNFLEEERQEDRIALHRTLARWLLAFIAIFWCAAMAFWWSGSAVQYSAARVQNRSKPTYQISGVITDSRTHQPVPWAEVSTEFLFGGAFFSTICDQNGQYSIMTLAEPQDLLVRANGYLELRLHVGKQWFSWTPHGSEKRNAELIPER